MITSGTSTFETFFTSLPKDVFVIVEKSSFRPATNDGSTFGQQGGEEENDDGTTIYPVEDILTIPASDPFWSEEVTVLWNEDNTLALVAKANLPDPHCYIFKDRAVLLLTTHKDAFDICDPDEFNF